MLKALKPDKPGIQVEADMQFGGERATGIEEESTVKLQTGDQTSTDITADTVTQIENRIQEYPIWLIIAFAAACGLAIPSPQSYFSRRRLRKAHEEQVASLREIASLATSITKRGERQRQARSQSRTSPGTGSKTAAGREPTAK